MIGNDLVVVNTDIVKSRMIMVRESPSEAGHKLAALIGDNLSTESAKTTIELNLAVLKITHEVTRTKKRQWFFIELLNTE